MAKLRTPEEVKARFAANGQTIAGWARLHGYPPVLTAAVVLEQHGYPPLAVYQVLGGFRKGARGQAHQIAVDLGLKPHPAGIAS